MPERAVVLNLQMNVLENLVHTSKHLALLCGLRANLIDEPVNHEDEERLDFGGPLQNLPW